jgi:hypothetical protein
MNVTCKHVSEKAMRDAMLAQIINHICDKHGCTAVIDFNSLTIDIDGPESKRLDVAFELDRFFG